MNIYVTVLIFLLFKIYKESLAELSCKDAIRNFDEYECLEPSDMNYMEENFNESKHFTIKRKDVSEYRTLKVKETTTTNERDIIELTLLKANHDMKYIVNVHEHKITEHYTYFVMDKIPELSIKSNLEGLHCMEELKDKIIFFGKVVKAVLNLHMKNIVNLSILDQSLRIDGNCEPLITDFSDSYDQYSYQTPRNINDGVEPLVARAFIHKKMIRYTEKMDSWYATELLYYLTHRRLPFYLNDIMHTVRTSKSLEIKIDPDIPVEIAFIIETGLLIDPTLRRGIGSIKTIIDDMIMKTKFTLLEKPMIIITDENFASPSYSFMTLFSEFIFIVLLVFFVIPIAVYVISKKVIADELRENEEAQRYEEQTIAQ